MKKFIALSAALIGSVFPVLGAPFVYTNGDLILGFQATSGTGSTKNVFVNLGSGVAVRDNPALGSFGNVSATLASAYGANWYSRTDLWFGVIGNLNGGSPTGFPNTAAVAGDPSRTFYVSSAAALPGQGNLFASGTFPSASLGSASTKLSGTESMLATLTAEANGSCILTQATQATEWNNGWTAWNPTPGASYDVFTGGIQQNFGKAGSGTYVDVQRILATNTGASPAGVVGGGTYETTIAISSSGAITAMKASPFSNWIAGFTSITSPADQLSSADPDGDGASNLEEFGFGGDPANPAKRGVGLTQTVDANADSQRDITVTLEVRSGASFTPSGNHLTATIDEVTYQIEGSMDLSTWDSVVSEVVPNLGSGSPSTGYVFKTFRLNAGNGLSGKGFLRGVVTK